MKTLTFFAYSKNRERNENGLKSKNVTTTEKMIQYKSWTRHQTKVWYPLWMHSQSWVFKKYIAERKHKFRNQNFST